MKNLITIITLAFLATACSTERSRCYDKCVKAKNEKYKHIGGASKSDRDGCYHGCAPK